MKNRRRATILIAYLGLLISPAFAQKKKISAYNSLTGKSLLIKKGDFIQCRYKVWAEHELLAGGVVRQITDSSIGYSTNLLTLRKEIALSTITSIDPVPLKRALLPALAIGVIVGETDIRINPQASPDISTMLIGAGTLINLAYVYKIDQRHLNKNIIGSKVFLDVVN